MNQDFSQNDVIIEVRDGLGFVTFNRPKALNALTLEVIRPISSALKSWENDNSIKAVLFKGAGDRAFCSGGDLKLFHSTGMNFRRGAVGHRTSATFFAEEYSLNRQIFRYPKPTISIMDGIVMGGGFGIGGNCLHRIATEKTSFAMPEVGIGFFPDVGSAYHLLKSPKNMGRYIALTALRVNGSDMVKAGLADYYFAAPQDDIVALVQKWLKEGREVRDILSTMKDKAPASGVFTDHIRTIEKCFGFDTVREIFGALAHDGSVWALETLEVMKGRSPTSMLVTAEHLKRSLTASFEEIIHVDFILAQRFLERADFYEGIRAAVIDKDRKPKWNPDRFDAVTQTEVHSYFTQTGYNLDDVEIFAVSSKN